MWLFDTCSLINISYCSPIATLFRGRYSDVGWMRAVATELVDQRTRRPPHPQAGIAMNLVAPWLGTPIELVDVGDAEKVEEIQLAVAAGHLDHPLDHLGESASIWGLLKFGGLWANPRLISDDRGARDEARRRGLPAASTVRIIAALLALDPGPVSVATADLYLDTLRTNGRMHLGLTSADLLANTLDSWE